MRGALLDALDAAATVAFWLAANAVIIAAIVGALWLTGRL